MVGPDVFLDTANVSDVQNEPGQFFHEWLNWKFLPEVLLVFDLDIYRMLLLLGAKIEKPTGLSRVYIQHAVETTLAFTVKVSLIQRYILLHTIVLKGSITVDTLMFKLNTIEKLLSNLKDSRKKVNLSLKYTKSA